MSCRATSNPVNPGIWTSRNTTSGSCSSISLSASIPFAACPTTSRSPMRPSWKHNSSRANCSSSTTTTWRGATDGAVLGDVMSGGDPFLDQQLRDLDARHRALARLAVDLQLVVLAVDHLEPLVDV